MQLKFLVLLALFGVVAQASPYKEIKKWAKKISMHHFLTNCWGEENTMGYYKEIEEATEECMQLAPAFEIELFESSDNFENFIDDDDDMAQFVSTKQDYETLPNGLPGNPMEAWLAFWAQNYGKGQKFQFNRNKRAVDPPSQEDYIKFAQGLAEFKAEKKANIANLTCVLRKMDYFDSKLGVNIKHFTRDMWSKMKNVDPEMKSRMVEGYQMCYEYSESIPQDLLEKKGPFFAQFGRQMKFFKCGEKVGMSVCVKKELLKWVDYLYGKPNASMRAKLGLPADEYEAAFVGMTAKGEMESDTKKFVMKFFFGH